MDLYDDGSGADTTRDDGIYSRYLVAVNYAGRYTVQCQVWDDGSAYINDGFIANRATNSRVRRDVFGSNATKTGSFSRQADGGSFKVNIYFSLYCKNLRASFLKGYATCSKWRQIFAVAN